MKNRWLLFLSVVCFMTIMGACGQAVTNNDELVEGEEAMDTNDDWNVQADATQLEDGEVLVDIDVVNQMEEGASLDFTSGQIYEIVFVNEDGEEQYRFSHDMMFTMALTQVDFEAGETKTYQETIRAKGWGQGLYTVNIEVVAAAVNGEELTNKEFFKAETTVEIN
ncbi:BsuPI-related putative proteinase inhibitor [Bacillus sp. FJAT-45037]|uniref:BsuPI-related putative proteinase inhibitor n=1 Tax=Bacillus sp. FJAT-45037 TaxID=2011007 RepID=UPI0012FD24E7|nr:BsuPI-related putative proteinase inhibitor [Bacillus sp. FJAT-45037]